MNRTKFIYFLSAIVLILGCYALNLSYSLFVETDSKEVVSTTVPLITEEVTLSLPFVSAGGDKDYLIKQTITNNNSIPVGFKINATSDSSSYSVQSTKYGEDVYLSYGVVGANTTKDVYLKVSNPEGGKVQYCYDTLDEFNTIECYDTFEQCDIAHDGPSGDSRECFLSQSGINFTIDYNYATLKMNTEDYLVNSNINNEEQYEIVVSTGNGPYSDNLDSLAYKLIEHQFEYYGTPIETVGEQYCYDTLDEFNTIECYDTFEQCDIAHDGPSGDSRECFLSNVNPSLDEAFTYSSVKSLPLVITDGILNVVELTEVLSAETDDVGLYKAKDDYGTSYYFRGAQSNNYVNFAGFIWRVVRINGDGSIRLILDGSLDLVKHENESDYVYKNDALYALDDNGKILFNSLRNDNAYVGYMYGDFDTNSTSYDDAHENIKSSTIKTYLETFYEEYLYQYQNDFIADTLFCGDKTRIVNFLSSGFGGKNTTYYGAYGRLFNSNKILVPTLECAKRDTIDDKELSEQQLSYSRYTSIIDLTTKTNNGVLVNNDLTYPIGLLSADEMVLAGAFRDNANSSYYLNDAYNYNPKKLYNYWWTMTPSSYNGSVSFLLNSYASSINFSNCTATGDCAVRPVINLKAGILWNGGDGSQGSPYTVKVR